MRMKLVVVAGAFALAGCSFSGPMQDDDPPSDPDGVSCAHSLGASSVYIDVEYGSTEIRTPTPTCAVDPGTVITWRAEVRSRERFGVSFTGPSPVAGGEPRSFNSEPDDGRQRIVLTAGNASGTYRYTLLTSTGGVDPAIIIR